MYQKTVKELKKMAESDQDKIKEVLSKLKEAVKLWEEEEDLNLIYLIEEWIFELTTETIASEIIPVNNQALVVDCKKAVVERKSQEESEEEDWPDYHTIMQKVANGEYGKVLPHLKEMAEIIMKMFE